MTKKSKAYQEFFKKGNFPAGVSPESLNFQIQDFQNEIQEYISAFHNNNSLFSGVAFVSVNSETVKREILETFKLSGWHRFKLAFKDIFVFGKEKTGGLLFHNHRMFLKQAPEPLDVYWENLGLSDREFFLRKMAGRCFSFLLLIGCACLIYYFSIKEDEIGKWSQNDIETQIYVKFLSNSLAFTIIILNKVLSTTMPKIVS